MDNPAKGFAALAADSRHFAQGLLTIGQNRLELLTVEIQEERERLLQAFLLALAVMAFGLLALLVLTAALVALLWAYSPVLVLLGATAVHGSIALYLYLKLRQKLRDWQFLAATLDQLEKDRACLEKTLA